MRKILILAIALSTVNCNRSKNITVSDSQQSSKEQILKTEEDFKTLSQSKGIQQAFYTFADDNAVIKRENDTLIQGKENIKSYYGDAKYKKAAVTWKPDFVDVSADGTLAYTYGKYVWTTTDSLGNKKEYKGRFHTVWKKQKDGSWKYVWD